jgi:uncharacterized membrane protein YqjE
MPTPATPSPTASPASLPRVVIEGLIHRSQLAGLELREARTHAAGTAAAAAVAAVLVLLGGFAGTFAFAAAVWNSPHRGLILAFLTVTYFLAAAALGGWTIRRLKTWRPLAETLYQIREDSSCLHHHLSERSR